MKNNKYLIFAICPVLIFSLAIVFAESAELNPGVERWAIKTSLASNPKKRTLSIQQLMALKNPIEQYAGEEKEKYEEHRIPTAITPDGLKEGDIITTTAWLHLVALENDSKKHRDGDYHIQLRDSEEWGDGCLIVEVPKPEFVTDEKLSKDCKKVRDFIKSKLLKDKEPGTIGNVMTHPVYVTVTGQLFFDAPHVKGNPRGKRDMKSHTPWELHPVTDIRFASKPQK